MTTPEAQLPAVPGRARVGPGLIDRVSQWPWWLLTAIALGLYVIYTIINNPLTNRAFWFISGQELGNLTAGQVAVEGFVMTIFITVVAYSAAVVIGLIVGLGRVSANVVINNAATFYVEIIRGIPILVLIMAIAFVGVSAFLDLLHSLGQWLVSINVSAGASLLELTSRDIDNTWRVIIALAVAYGAFSAEIFRAGIQSVQSGQMEAARALGMSYFQAMRYIILPQAIRAVLPALGNDFVAMLKDSSLAMVLGVREMTQLNKLYVSSTFNFVQGYIVLAFLYLTMTILLSRLVRLMEARMSRSYA